MIIQDGWGLFLLAKKEMRGFENDKSQDQKSDKSFLSDTANIIQKLEVIKMNKHDIQRARVEDIKKTYPPGTRIELISMNDAFAPVPSGTRGTVSFVDDIGTIHPVWDNGRTLGLIVGEDSFRKLSQSEIEAEQQAAEEKREPDNAEDLNDTGDMKMNM